jgi:PAS domain S-box-containing protein
MPGGGSGKQSSRSKRKPKGRLAAPQPAGEAGFRVSDTLKILEYLGRTGPYLEIAPGQASLRLEAMLQPRLAAEVRKLIEQAKRLQAPVTKRRVALAIEQPQRVVHIRVVPRREGSSGRFSYQVLLEEAAPRAKTAVRPATAEVEAPQAPQAARLSQELATIRERFGSLIAEQDQKYQETLKELQTTAQERKKTSEDLQVTNAELEAANAELEATNEELRAALAAKAQAEKRLGASEGQMRALLETATQAILAVEADGKIGLVNATAEKMFGYSREELLGLPIERLVPSRLRGLHRERRKGYFEQPRSRPMGEGLDLRAQRKDGTTFPVEISLSYIQPGDEIVAVAFVSDITEREQADARRRLLSEITQNMSEGVTMIEAGGVSIVYANHTFERLFGYAPGELLGRPVTILNAGDAREKEATARTIMDSLERSGTWRGEVHNVKKDGTLFWCDYSIFTMKHPKYGPVWVGICSDVTERKAAEHAVRRSQQELRLLTARLISLQEEQYTHLSRELHDAFGQKLAALGMELTALEGQSSDAEASSKQRLHSIGEQIAGMADDIHRISRRLHPTILDDLGLVAALKNECVEFSRQQGIEVEFDAARAPERIPEDVKLCLYRVTQESLTNIARHARAREVRVRLSGSPSEVVLTIEDVGNGFDLEEVRGKGGLGLVSMDERVRLVQGNLLIESQPGKGTKVEVRVPLRRTRPRRPR